MKHTLTFYRKYEKHGIQFCLSHKIETYMYNTQKTAHTVNVLCVHVYFDFVLFFFSLTCVDLFHSSPIPPPLTSSPQNHYLSRKCYRVLCNLLLVLCKYDYLQTYRYTNVLFPHDERAKSWDRGVRWVGRTSE